MAGLTKQIKCSKAVICLTWSRTLVCETQEQTNKQNKGWKINHSKKEWSLQSLVEKSAKEHRRRGRLVMASQQNFKWEIDGIRIWNSIQKVCSHFQKPQIGARRCCAFDCGKSQLFLPSFGWDLDPWWNSKFGRLNIRSKHYCTSSKNYFIYLRLLEIFRFHCIDLIGYGRAQWLEHPVRSAWLFSDKRRGYVNDNCSKRETCASTSTLVH